MKGLYLRNRDIEVNNHLDRAEAGKLWDPLDKGLPFQVRGLFFLYLDTCPTYCVTCICVCLTKRDSLCRLNINNASGFNSWFILGTPVHIVANSIL